MSTRTQVIVLSIVGVLVVGLFANLTLPVRTAALTVFGTPVARMEGAFDVVWDAVRLGGFFSRDDGRARAIAEGQEETRALMQQENDVTDRARTRERDASGGSIIAPIIRRSFTALEQSLVIATPPEAHEDMRVYAEGALIGNLASVIQGRGVVTLLWSPGEYTRALLASSGVPVELEGQGAGFWTARVPRSQKVVVGEVLVLNHASRDVIGAVRAVSPESANPFTEFVVRSSVNPSVMQFVTLQSYAQ